MTGGGYARRMIRWPGKVGSPDAGPVLRFDSAPPFRPPPATLHVTAYAEEPLVTPERVVYGPCPACDAWQVDVPAGIPLAEIEDLLNEHDREDHPGELRCLAAEGIVRGGAT